MEDEADEEVDLATGAPLSAREMEALLGKLCALGAFALGKMTGLSAAFPFMLPLMTHRGRKEGRNVYTVCSCIL